MNSAAEKLFGSSGDTRHYVTAIRQPLLLDAVEMAFKRGDSSSVRYLHQVGASESVFMVKVQRIDAPSGSGVLLAFDDITEQERAGEMRRDFVANVSHELKTPLTALVGFIDTLQGAARDDAAARERFLGIMASEAGRMNRLVSDLLSLSRVESTERQLPTDLVDMRKLADRTVSALATLAETEKVPVVIEADDVSGHSLVVRGDADQLQQVLTNLIENAIKYGGDGGEVTVRLTHSAREVSLRGPAAKIEVIDRGEGVDPVHISRLTERFYRVDSHRSREMGGTGLGLAIAKHIVNRHRGRLRIDSEPGRGATFTVLLPAIA